jgi:rubrerythrin
MVTPDDKVSLRIAGMPENLINSLEFRAEERKLIAVLNTHSERESAALDSYTKLVTQSEDEGIRYLGQLIIEDEERHHQIIDEMLNTIRSWVDEVDVEPHAPAMVGRVSHDLLAETERLLDFEKADLAELRHLKKRLELASSFPLLNLLVKLMIHDTRKHIAILKFIRSSSKD